MISFSSAGMVFSAKRKIQQQSTMIYWLQDIAKRKNTFSLVKSVHFDQCSNETINLIYGGVSTDTDILVMAPFVVHYEGDKPSEVGFVAFSDNAVELWKEYSRGLNLFLPLVKPACDFTQEERDHMQKTGEIARQTIADSWLDGDLSQLAPFIFRPLPQTHRVPEYNDWFSGSLEITGPQTSMPALETLANDNKPHA